MDLRNCPRVRYYLSGRHGDELNNGAMAQLVARFHGMEEVGGSNPPSSTENSDTQVVSVGFLLPKRPVCWLFFQAASGVGAALWVLMVCAVCLSQAFDYSWSVYFFKNNVLVSACGMFKICQT